MQTVFAEIAKLAKYHAELLNQPRLNLPLQRRCWHIAMTAAYFVKSNGHPRRFVAVKTLLGTTLERKPMMTPDKATLPKRTYRLRRKGGHRAYVRALDLNQCAILKKVHLCMVESVFRRRDIMTSIGHFSLDNGSGMYVCALDIVWWDNAGTEHKVSDAASDIALYQCKSADPGAHGVPNGSTVALRLNVKSAQQKDITASEKFTYQSGNVTYANYTASGTTFNPGLDLINIGSNYCAQKASAVEEKSAAATASD